MQIDWLERIEIKEIHLLENLKIINDYKRIWMIKNDE